MIFKVVSIKINKRSQFCLVLLDSGEDIRLHTDLVVKYALFAGKEINEQDLKIISEENDLIVAKRIAYNYASYSFRTSKQVHDRLSRESFSEEIIADCLAFLVKFNLLDDERYAKEFIKAKLKSKSPSINKLKRDLYAKGIDSAVIDSAIEAVYPKENTFEIAMKAASKKLRLIANKPKEKHKPALFNYLAGQGFDSQTIFKVIEKLKIE